MEALRSVRRDRLSHQRQDVASSSSRSPLVTAFLAGSFSGVASTLLFQPLDLLKTRLQTSGGKEAGGLTRALASVVTRHGVAGLWRGLAPSLARTVPGVGLYFSAAHSLRASLAPDPSPATSLLVGAAARSLAVTATIPVTVVKLRCEAAEAAGTRASDIWRVEGVRGLTRGLLPTILRDAPFSGIYMMLYDTIKTAEWNSYDCPLGNGVLAGCVATILTQPADVVKTQLQAARAGPVSATAAAAAVLAASGPRGLFRGLAPRMVRRSLIAGLAWSVYETAMKKVGIK